MVDTKYGHDFAVYSSYSPQPKVSQSAAVSTGFSPAIMLSFASQPERIKFTYEPIYSVAPVHTYGSSLGNIINRDRNANLMFAEEILFLSLADFASQNKTHDYEYYIDDIVRKLDRLQYMNATAKEIYSQYPYSESVLLREFKKRTGMSIVEYRTQQKLKYACHLLTETDARVLGIALTLNYSSLSYFVRAFRKTYGMNPAEYRKLHKKSPTH